jgi:hypothetical protein
MNPSSASTHIHTISLNFGHFRCDHSPLKADTTIKLTLANKILVVVEKSGELKLDTFFASIQLNGKSKTTANEAAAVLMLRWVMKDPLLYIGMGHALSANLRKRITSQADESAGPIFANRASVRVQLNAEARFRPLHNP